MQLFKGFIRNYSTLMFHREDRTLKKFTERELGFFAKAGEMMGYYTFQEEKVEIKGKKRHADLVWTTYNHEIEEYSFLLHLEHENDLSVKETLEQKLSNSPNLIAINWSKPEDYPTNILSAKDKFKESEDIKRILLILQTKLSEVFLLHAIEFTRKKRDIELRECDALIKQDEAGFFYGLLKTEIDTSQWEELISL